MKIIYKQDDGTVAVIVPVLTEINLDTGNPYTINEIAAKGQRHKIKTITLKYFINLI